MGDDAMARRPGEAVVIRERGGCNKESMRHGRWGGRWGRPQGVGCGASGVAGWAGTCGAGSMGLGETFSFSFPFPCASADHCPPVLLPSHDQVTGRVTYASVVRTACGRPAKWGILAVVFANCLGMCTGEGGADGMCTGEGRTDRLMGAV